MYRDNVGGKPQRPHGRGFFSALFRPLRRMGGALLGILSGRMMVREIEEMVEDREDNLLAPNATGLPEADLTEEQRREAIRRIKKRPRIG